MSDKKQPTDSKQPAHRGRKAESGNIRLQPVFRKEPDIEKLGRAIIAMAMRTADIGSGEREGLQNDEKV